MFISEEEFNSWNYQTCCNALERVHSKAIEDTLKMLPDIILGLIVKTKGIQKSFADFKSSYPDIASREQELALLIETIELEDGSKDLDTILKEVPERFRALDTAIPVEQPKNIEEAERTANGFI